MAVIVNTLNDVLKLYFVMGSNNCESDPVVVLEEALKGGITCFQYREKGAQAKIGREKIELARRLQQLCREHEVPFIVNDEIELMKELDADGLHIGQEDGDVEKIRRQIPGKILGVSAHNVKEAEDAIRQGADYLGVGPVYPTITKKDTRPVMGTTIIRQLREKGITVPTVGIGGIQIGKARPVIEAGANGIAVISSISMADSPIEAARRLLDEVSFVG
ncbi:thiamine phosphate synthase [Fictibacillus sp. Mic-4]|nr:thiamine phosphate synthase [Fictibacillus gelatini]